MTLPGEIVDNAPMTHRGPVSGVTVHAHMRSGPHGLMEYPLDLTLATELMFLFAEQARRGPDQEPLRITPQSVLEHLKSIGVRSGNGRTIGRDAVYESFARLRGMGYIRRIFDTDEKSGQRTGVAYEFYDWPAWNPEAPDLTASPQVGATSGIAGSGNAGSRKQERTKKRSSQVGATSGIAGSGNAGSRTKPQVGATSGIAGSPPHPPEVVVTTSPYPLTDGARPHPPQTEGEGERYAQEDLTAAADLLQRLGTKWRIGKPQAVTLAPMLLGTMSEQGWPSIGDVDRQLLSAELTDDAPPVIRSAYRLLSKERIPNLRLYTEATRAPERAQGTSTPPRGLPALPDPSQRSTRSVTAILDGLMKDV